MTQDNLLSMLHTVSMNKDFHLMTFPKACLQGALGGADVAQEQLQVCRPANEIDVLRPPPPQPREPLECGEVLLQPAHVGPQG